MARNESAMTTSGIATTSALTTVTMWSAKRPRCTAAHKPTGTDTIHVRTIAEMVSSNVFFARLQSNGATGTLYEME